MAVDPKLYAARRLGFGLRADQDLDGAPRDWAMAQIRSIPKLDFYKSDGTSMGDAIPPDAQLVDYPAACDRFGEEDAAEEALLKSHGGDEEFWQVFAKYWELPYWGAAMATTLTAVNGPSPVFERFWQFWCNHFTASISTGHGKILLGSHIQELRATMTGSFEDMLLAAIANPATIYYLDGVYSVGPHSRSGKSFSLNENLGRELLELYSVSPAAGYTQADVVESALILTGWTFSGGAKYKKTGVYFAGAKAGVAFDVGYHEPGARTVMGKTYAADNKTGGQLKALIKDLAVHPSTATFIATKLARAFVGDQPPQDSIDRIAAAFSSSKGDLVTVHSAVIDEALTAGPNFAKFMRPGLWLQQAHKALGARIDLDMPSAQTLRAGLTQTYRDLGEEFCGPPQPSGWSELEADWLSMATLDRRVRYATLLSRKVDTTVAPHLGDYIARFADGDSALSQACQAEKSVHGRAVLLLASPQFLRI